MPPTTELIDSSSSRAALHATYREALHRGLSLPTKDNELSEQISRLWTGMPDGRLYRAIAMLERAGRLRVTRNAHSMLVIAVSDLKWDEIESQPIKHINKVDRWWFHVLRILSGTYEPR